MRHTVSETAKHAVIVLVLLAVFFPFLLMLSLSLKDPDQTLRQLFVIAPPFHFENYLKAWHAVSPLIVNSIVMAAGSALLAAVAASLAGFGFAKLKFPLSKPLFYVLFIKMMLPGVLNFIPSFVLAWKMGLLNTYWAVILFAVGTNMPFWVFVMTTFIQQQPKDLFDSMRIDGATEAQVYRKLALPLSRPIVFLLAINVFIGVWNDYTWPLVVLPAFEMRPITVGLAYITSTTPGDYGPLTAGYALASVPLFLIFLVSMKQFVKGLTAGSIKL